MRACEGVSLALFSRAAEAAAGKGAQHVHQGLGRKRFAEKGDAANFHCLLLERFTIAPSHEYDGDGEARLGKVAGKVESTTVAQMDIDNEAQGLGRHRNVQELFRRSIEFRVVPNS